MCRKNSNFTAMNPKTLISPEETSSRSDARRTLISTEETSDRSGARRTLISLDGGVISNPLRRLPAPASFQLRQGECIALVGPVGSGKSTLLKMITGGFYLREGSLRMDLGDESYRAIRFVEFDNAYSTTETQYYHQQRWQAFEREASPLAGELLGMPAGTIAEERTKENKGDTAGRQLPDTQRYTETNPHQNTGCYLPENTDCQNVTCQDTMSWQRRLFEILNIGPLLGKEIITLSSGELRRFSIARALLQRPQVLVLESPFIGLDPPTRQALCDLLEQVLNTLGISIIMTLTDPDRIPPVATHFYFMRDGMVSKKMSAAQARQDWSCRQADTHRLQGPLSYGAEGHIGATSAAKLPHRLHDPLPGAPHVALTATCELPVQHQTKHYDKVVQMRGINISYGERQIFRDLNWTVRSGERWNVTGPNGSGKSTLLSLVNADNPRAYSLDITLFDRRRGTGESIWDIKRHIGYLSSEMHSSFRENLPVLEIVRSGLGHNGDGHFSAEAMKGFATGVSEGGDRLSVREQNLYTSRMPVSGDERYLLQWLRLFGAEHLARRNYLTLSSGEQRYILLIRAFVKDPDLLILDEPFQGLDPELRHRGAAVIEAFCAAKNKTLIFVTHYLDEVPGVVTHTLQL